MDHTVLEKDKQEHVWFGYDSPGAAMVGSCLPPLARSQLFCLHLLHILLLAAPFQGSCPIPHKFISTLRTACAARGDCI